MLFSISYLPSLAFRINAEILFIIEDLDNNADKAPAPPPLLVFLFTVK